MLDRINYLAYLVRVDFKLIGTKICQQFPWICVPATDLHLSFNSCKY